MPLRIVPCLWFDHEAQEAARFYTSVFENSRIVEVTHYPEGSPRPAGTVMTVDFELDGERLTALNGGPEFTFDEAISLQVMCQTQEQIDYYWQRLSDGGDEGPERSERRSGARAATPPTARARRGRRRRGSPRGYPFPCR
jgi:predicted 3-demethylubiquinone-9 3-methyltransferase (glyoxalase superfamily)